MYEMHEKVREILTEYNDTILGRCSICLEAFSEENSLASSSESQRFTDRHDLVRIDNCFHRFHLLCVARDWFMTRKVEKDQFGCEYEFKLPDNKKCPVCRREVAQSEIDYIKEQMKKHPEVGKLEYG